MHRERLFRGVMLAVPAAVLCGLELLARVGREKPSAEAMLLASISAETSHLLTGSGLLLEPHAEAHIAGLVPGCVGDIRTNAIGMRGPEANEAKAPGTLRVACLGDSVTFGWCAAEEDSYPRQLEDILRERLAPRAVEVLNLGIPGTTSSRGVMLARHVLPRLHPDVVIVAYGYNDSSFTRPVVTSSGPVARARRLLARSALYRALGSGLSRFSRRDPLGAPQRGSPPSQLRYNLFLIVTACRALGASVILADLDFPNFYPRPVLETVAANQGLPLLRGRELLDAHATHRPEPPGLAPAGATPSSRRELVLRVAAPGAEGAPSVVGDHPGLGMLPDAPPSTIPYVPGRARMRDDGLEGDEQAGDGVFSFRLLLDGEPRSISYTFVPFAPEGSWGRREVPGLPVPPSWDVFYRVRAGPGRTLTPVHLLGRCPYEELSAGEAVHLNREGLRIVAAALEDLIMVARPRE